MPRAASGAINELAAVDAGALAESDCDDYNDAAMRPRASHWVAEPLLKPGGADLHVVTAAGRPGEP